MRGVFLMLVPRKPERFDVVAGKLDAAGIAYVRRSRLGQDGPGADAPGVLLLDSIGELGGLFGLADCVFMGGTLAARGGHNILEPALFGKAGDRGSAHGEFPGDRGRVSRGAARWWRSAGRRNWRARWSACWRTMAASERGRASARRRGAGRRRARWRPCARSIACRATVRRCRGICAAWVLARVWRWEARRRQVAYYARRRKLDVPVISVGNLTMGGTGKTPCVLRLAELLRERGRKPGILTRGYGRKSPVTALALPAGATVRTEESGDEPQIFLRARVAPVGIGADRYRTGTLLREKFGTDVMLLDDGFQHVRLARNFDVVLIDALNPFGGGEVFPVGRLREPVQGWRARTRL